jgi:hypothetical protein
MRAVIPVIVTSVALFNTVTVVRMGRIVTTYWVEGVLPITASHCTTVVFVLGELAVRFAGAGRRVEGTTGADALDALLVPTALVVVTVNV